MAAINIEVQARTDAATRNLNALADSAYSLGRKMNDDAAGALGAFGISLTKLDQPLTLVAEGLKQSIDKARNWGDEMGDLATKTGMTVKQASTMAVVFEDVGLSMGTLEAAAKAATKNGLQFNLDTLKKLSAQYQAIDDPVQRSQFAMEKFGRAGLEMTEILSRDAANLDELGRAALYSGKVIGEDAAGAAEKFNIQLKQLEDKVDGAQIAIGNALIPVLSNAVDGLTSLLGVTQAVNIVIQKSTGLITDEEAAWKAQRLAAGDLLAAYQDYTPVLLEMADRTKDDTVAVIAQKDAMGLAYDEIVGLQAGADAFAADMAMQKRLEELTGAASDLKFGMGELTTATLFNQAAMGLDSDAAYALAKSMGLIKPDADAAKQILDGLRAELERGAITTGEYEGKVKMLDLAIRSLPDGKTITVEYVEQYRRELSAEQNRGAQRQGGAIGDGYASGGSFIVPPGYPNDSYPMRVSSGELVTVVPTNATFNINGAGNPQAVAGAVRAELDRLGRQTDTRLRTR